VSNASKIEGLRALAQSTDNAHEADNARRELERRGEKVAPKTVASTVPVSREPARGLTADFNEVLKRNAATAIQDRQEEERLRQERIRKEAEKRADELLPSFLRSLEDASKSGAMSFSTDESYGWERLEAEVASAFARKLSAPPYNLHASIRSQTVPQGQYRPHKYLFVLWGVGKPWKKETADLTTVQNESEDSLAPCSCSASMRRRR
jgi:hypothetical protein